MMKLKIPNKVILVAYCTFNSYGMLRTLHQIGIKPYLIINNNPLSPTYKSRFGGPKIVFDNVEVVPQILIQNFANEKVKPIVICCDDKPQSIVDQHYDELKNHFYLANIDNREGAIIEMMAKTKQYEMASKCGVITPKSWICKQGSSVPDDIIFPCIAKPLKSIQGSKDDIRICYSSEELSETLTRRDYLVQQYIEKDFEVILWGTSLSDGDYFISGVARKIRQFPTEWGLSSFGVLESFESHPQLNKQAICDFLKSLRYTGMFSIEMVVKDNKYNMVEINLRNDGKQHFSTAAGANLPLLYISSMLGLPYTLPQPKYPSYFMGEKTDFHHVMAGKLKFGRWLRDMFRSDSFFIVNGSDIIAWLPGYLNDITQFIKRKLNLSK